ncbi:hypothetical protein HDU67_000151 [Dinochytrium kinnereticum]|nr:hypothetical protein HDU67_000151 [Dinochytrium kinnereticum]
MAVLSSRCAWAKALCFLIAISASIPHLASATAAFDYLTLTGSSLRHGHIPTANLDPAVVGSPNFGRIFPQGFTRLPTINGVPPGTNYAAPMVYTTESGQTIVFVATMNNNMTFVNAAKLNIWVPFLSSDLKDIPLCGDINSNVGVTGSPVIDPATGTAYFLSKTYAPGTSSGLENGRYRIHAVDVLTLAERPNYPRDIQGTPAENDPRTTFNGGIQLQRPGLHFLDNTVYVAFGSHCGLFRAIGWLIGFDAPTGDVVTAWVTDANPTNQGGAGIWQSGNGVAAVGDKMYVVTGNAYASPVRSPTPGNQIPETLGNAVIELSINRFTRKISPTDYFLPFNYQAMNGGDRDFGAGGFTLFPNDVPGVFSTDKVKRIGAAVGKPGDIFIFDVDNLGGFQQGPGNGDLFLQKVKANNSVFGQVTAFPGNGGYMYFGPAGNPIQAYKWAVDSEGNPSFFYAGQSDKNTFQFSGSPVVTSIDGQDDTGIVWYIDFSGSLIAYRAVPVDQKLVRLFSDTPSGLYPYNKFLRPAFGNGKVYTVSSDGRLFAFGSPDNFPLKAPDTNFGLVILGQPQTRTINFTVIADTVEVVAIEISNRNFTLAPNGPTLPLTLTKGQSLLIPVTLDPTSTGSFTAQLTVQTSSSARVLSFATLRGSGKSQTPRLLLSPPNIVYGNVITNAGAVTSIVQIANQGIEPLVIKGLILPDAVSPFRVLNPPPSNTVIESDSSITVSVEFRPTEDGTFTGSFTIDTNGGVGTISLSGTSAGPPIMKLESELPDGSWSPNTTVEFGTIFPGQTKVMRVRVLNVGASRLTLTKVKLPQVGPIQGNINDIGEGLQLNPGDSVTVPITFIHPSRPPTVLGGQSFQVRGELPLNSDDAEGGVRSFFFSGTAGFPSLPPPFETWVHVDCFEYTGPRILTNALTNGQSSVMTPQLCIQNCWTAPQGRYPVAGLEFAGECWCGTRLPVSGGGSRKCTLACRGNSTALCGGPGALNVYVNPAIIPVTGSPTTTTTISSTSTTTTTTTTAIATSTALTTSTSSSPTSSPTSPPSSPWSYVGCTVNGGTFNGGEVPRLFPAGLLGTGYTPATCQAACLADNRGFTFAGLEYGGECWCGQSISSRIPAPETDCSTPCTADTSQICGGGNRLSLFAFAASPSTTTITSSTSTMISVPSTILTTTVEVPTTTQTTATATPSSSSWTYVGCTVNGGSFNGAEVSRLFPDGLIGVGYTPGTCQSACLADRRGFLFAGVEFGGECWCGRSITNRIVAPERDCNMACNADRSLICGGGSRMSLFAFNVAVSSSSSSTYSSTATTSVPTTSATSTTEVDTGVEVPTTTITITTSVDASATATASATPRWEYVGCTVNGGSFNGEPVSRLFPAGQLPGVGYTVTTCQAGCLARGFQIAGMEFGGECWCGSSANARVAAPEAGCSMPCTADRSQICGGGNRLSLYQYIVPTTTSTTSTILATTAPTPISEDPVQSPVPPPAITTAPPTTSPWSYIGCTVNGGTFNGSSVPRLFPGGLVGTRLTPTTCQQACLAANRGWTFAGVEFGGECWCGRDVSKRIAAPESDCNIRCNVDTSIVCGGRTRMSLFGLTVA